MDAALVDKAKRAVRACGHFAEPKDVEGFTAASQLEQYILIHDLTIYKKLITLYHDIVGVGKEIEFDSLIFIGNSLEVAGHVVTLGTSRRTYLEGIDWVKKEYADADPPPTPRHVLAALVLIYLIASTETEKGKKVLLEAENEVNEVLAKEKPIDSKAVWARIREIVEVALKPSEVAGAAPGAANDTGNPGSP